QPCAIRAGGSLAPPLQRLFGLMAGYAGAAITLSLGLIRPTRPRSAAPRLFLSFCTTQFTDTRRPDASRPVGEGSAIATQKPACSLFCVARFLCHPDRTCDADTRN